MKKIALLSLALMATSLLATADLPIKTWEEHSQNLQIFNICNVTNEDLNEIMKGFHPDTAVEFSAHMILPIQFFLKGDLIHLIENKDKVEALEIQQTFYARCVGKDLIFSIDLIDWKPFLEFITGNVSVALTIRDGTPSLVFGSETNRRL